MSTRTLAFPVTRTVAIQEPERTVAPVTTSRRITVVDNVRTITVNRRGPVAVVRSTRTVSPLRPTRLVTVAQGGPGPIGLQGEAGNTFETTNKQGASIAAGAPMATHSTGVGAVLADAVSAAKPCIGLNVEAAADLAAIEVQTSGPFELADWTAVTGSASLAAKAVYFLSATTGLLTTTSPTNNPHISQRVGKAVSPTILDIDPWGFVQL